MTVIENIARVACPGCGRKGRATWQMSPARLPRRLHDLTAGFLGIDVGAAEGPRIVCQRCRLRANEDAAGA